jgi:hypothetical protein
MNEHPLLARRYAFLSIARFQDDQVRRIRQMLADAPDPGVGDAVQWYCAARGVGHGSRPGVVPTEKPERAVPRDIEESL